MQHPAITKHLQNIFSTEELAEDSVCSILEHTAADGKTYSTKYYDLDAIIAVGYRVNSFQATQFRIWATRTAAMAAQSLIGMKPLLQAGALVHQIFERRD